MSQTPPKPRRRRGWLIAAGVSLALVLSAAWYVRTDRFRFWVHGRIVTALEDATGGRAELGEFHLVPMRLRIEGRNLTLHGNEKAGSPPLGHADTVIAELRLTALLTGQIAFRRLTLEHPVVRIEFGEGDSTNIPVPKGPVDARPAPGQLFDLAIDRLDVHNGELQWNDERIPVEFSASGIVGGLSHSFFRRRFEGKVHAERIDTKLQDYRPFAWGGDLEFGLTRNRLDIKSLKATSGKSRLQFAGYVSEFAHPQITGSYEAQVDMADVGSVTRTKELAGGTADIRGEGKWTEESLVLTGKLGVRDGLWKMDNAGVRVASGSTQYSLTDKLEFRNLQGKALGGEFTGEVRVNHWLGAAPPVVADAKHGAKPGTRASKRADDSVGVIDLTLRDLAVGDLLTLLNSRDFPVDRLHGVGSASGTLQSKWTKRIDTADTEVDLTAKAPESAAAGTMPLSGTAHGTYHSTVNAAADTIDIARLSLATQSTKLESTGNLGNSASNLHLLVNAGNLAELQPLLSGFRGTAQVPLNLSGTGSFAGWLSGGLRQPNVAGRVELSGFSISRRGGGNSVLNHLRWDHLTSDIQASTKSVSAQHGLLQQGSTQVNFEGEAGLAEGAFTPESQVSARISFRDASVEELQSMLGYSYPISGRVSFSGQVGGNRGAPHGEGSLQLKDAKLYGEEVPSATAKVVWAGPEVSLQDLDLQYASGHVRGIFAYNLDLGTFHSQLDGDGIELANLPKIRDGQILTTGHVKFTAAGSGTLAEPKVDASLDVENLVLGEEDQGGIHLDASTRGAVTHFKAKSLFQNEEVTLDGDVQLRGDFPIEAAATLTNVDLDPLLQRYLRGQVTGHSLFTGTLSAKGSLARPAALEVQGKLSQFAVSVQNVSIANNGPLQFRVAQGVFHLDEAKLAGDNTELTAGGTIEIMGRREIDFHAAGRLNLGLLQTMYPDFLTTGTVEMQGRATGTLSAPVLQGNVKVTAGGVAVPGQPASLSDINGTLVFTQDRLQIEQLTARSGGGLIRLGGYMQYGRYLEFNVTAQGDDVRLRYPPGMSSTANADLRLYGTSNGAVLSGELQVTRFSLSPGFDFGSYLASNRQSTVLTGSDSLLNKIKFDLHIYTTPDLRFDSSLARVSGDADLRLRGTMAKPVLLGRTNIQEGQIFFNGAKYQLERGDISFTNPVKIDPVLDLAASIRVRDYDIEIGFHGTSDKLNVVYRSEPPLPQADIIALLALGRTQEESAQQGASQSAFTQEASSAILGQAINATVSNRVQKLFGVSRIKIDPQAPGTETSTYQGPQVTIEQQVSNKLTLTYVQPVSQTTQQTIQGEYNVTRNVSIVAVRDQNGVFALDIRIRHRKK